MDEGTINRPLSRAVELYLGAGVSSFPLREPGRVIAEFGVDVGRGLISATEALIEELSATRVDWATETLPSATSAAEDRMTRAHPELSTEAVRALGWEFAFSWR